MDDEGMLGGEEDLLGGEDDIAIDFENHDDMEEDDLSVTGEKSPAKDEDDIMEGDIVVVSPKKDIMRLPMSTIKGVYEDRVCSSDDDGQ